MKNFLYMIKKSCLDAYILKNISIGIKCIGYNYNISIWYIDLIYTDKVVVYLNIWKIKLLSIYLLVATNNLKCIDLIYTDNIYAFVYFLHNIVSTYNVIY